MNPRKISKERAVYRIELIPGSELRVITDRKNTAVANKPINPGIRSCFLNLDEMGSNMSTAGPRHRQYKNSFQPLVGNLFIYSPLGVGKNF
jgi:hypothetical protein